MAGASLGQLLEFMKDSEGCCAKHRIPLIEESVGLPLLALSDVNFSRCFDCRPPPTQHLIPPSGAAPPPSSPSLHEFLLEYSAAVAARSLRRSRAVFLETRGSARKRSSCRARAANKRRIIEEGVPGDDGDAHLLEFADDDDVDDDVQLPLHVLLSDCVLSHLPLADIIRARHVCRAWMSTIDAALKNPCSQAHAYIQRPCLMLLHPGSKKIGTCAALSVFEFLSNAWLTKPIPFPRKASYLVGASCGLFCFATDKIKKISCIDENADFFVGNPLTETWTLLPRPRHHQSRTCRSAIWERGLTLFAFGAYILDPNSACRGYKLIKVQPEPAGHSVNVYVYDSCTRKWDMDTFEGNRRAGCISHIDFETPTLVHCFDRNGSPECSYNLATRTLKNYHQQVSVGGIMDRLFGISFVMRCAETSFCVRRTLSGRFDDPITGLVPVVSHKWPLGVYRLAGDNARHWELLSMMPFKLLKAAVEEGSDGTDFVIGSDHSHRIFFILKGSSKMLVFDVLSSVWDTLPGCTFVPSFYPFKLHAVCGPLI